jgi:hypothetical protein
MSPGAFPFLAGTRTSSQADPPAPSNSDASVSASDQAASAALPYGSFSATPNAPPGASGPPPRVHGAASQAQGGTTSASNPPPLGSSTSPGTSSSTQPGAAGSGVASSAQSGSSTATAPDAALPDPPVAPSRPTTRSQHGIHKPKVYTDGTIRYGQLAATSEGPFDFAKCIG